MLFERKIESPAKLDSRRDGAVAQSCRQCRRIISGPTSTRRYSHVGIQRETYGTLQYRTCVRINITTEIVQQSRASQQSKVKVKRESWYSVNQKRCRIEGHQSCRVCENGQQRASSCMEYRRRPLRSWPPPPLLDLRTCTGAYRYGACARRSSCSRGYRK